MTSILLNILHIGIVGFLLSLVSISAMHKFRSPESFRRALNEYAVLPAASIAPVSRWVPWFESGVVVAAIMAFASSQSEITAALLFMLFGLYSAMLAWALLQKKTLVDCGCSLGHSAQGKSPAVLLARNLMLLALIVVFYLSASPLHGTLMEWLTGLAMSCFLLVFYISIDQLIENHFLLNTLRHSHD